MKSCMLCFSEFIEEDGGQYQYCPQLFELCCKYLHSAFTKDILLIQSRDQFYSFCPKCLESAVELVDLNEQMEFYQKQISELVFIISVGVLHRRGGNAAADTFNTDNFSGKKLIEVDVSALPNNDSWNISTSSSKANIFSVNEYQNVNAENNCQAEFCDPLLLVPELNDNENIVNVKIEKNAQVFIDEPDNNELQFEDSDREVTGTELGLDHSRSKNGQNREEYLELPQQSSSSGSMHSILSSSSVKPASTIVRRPRRKRVARERKDDCHASDDGEFPCLVCSKRFKRRYQLENHEMTHTGERPYRCAVCNSAFTMRHNLLVHERIHVGNLPFKCDVCGTGFTHQSTLLRHTLSHTGERPFKCDQCDYSVKSSTSLLKHKQTKHSKTDNFKCRECGKGFKSSEIVEIHYKHAHFALQFSNDCVIKNT